MKIGFFDSGVGGLIILKAVRAYIPEYDYVFLGDTANLPYGDKSENEIYKLTKSGIVRLFEEGAVLVIVACNTASAESLRKLQDTFLSKEHPGKKVLGVIIPTIETLERFHAVRPLLIATKMTIKSKKFEIELNKINSDIKLLSIATPNLVPLIEDNKNEEAFQSVKDTIDPVVGEIDAIVLGCTHYTMLKNRLKAEYKIPVISQDEIIPEKLKLYLYNHSEIKNQLSTGSSVEIILTKESGYYDNIKDRLL